MKRRLSARKRKKKLNDRIEGHESAQEIKEALFYWTVMAYLFIIAFSIWILKANLSYHSNNHSRFMLIFLCFLPFLLLIIYFTEIISVKLYLLNIKENIKNKIKLSRTEIAGIITILECILGLYILSIFEKLQ